MYKVTVGICCYKQKDWLYRCLRSLSSQTMDTNDFEVVVVNDDPSEDLSEVCSNLNDVLNIRLINNEKNIGLPKSLNKILKCARGQYFVRIDSDDYVSKHFLYMLSTFLFMNRYYQAVACDYKTVNELGETLESYKSAKDNPMACGVMFTYESLCNIGFYNEEFEMREGHELMSRFQKKYRMSYLEIPLYRYRMHKNNRTNNINEVNKFDKKLGENNE